MTEPGILASSSPRLFPSLQGNHIEELGDDPAPPGSGTREGVRVPAVHYGRGMGLSRPSDAPARVLPRVPLVLGAMVAVSLLGISALLVVAAPPLGLSSLALATALVPAALARWTLAPRRPGPVTAADLITILRMALTGPLLAAAVLVTAGELPERTWPVAVLAGATLLTDAADGPVARRTGTAGPIGARVDMEADALLLLALSGLAASTVGPWVLAIGLLRYAYVAASRLRPALRRPLAYSGFRRGVAAIQGITLVVALVPIVPAPVAVALTGLALTLLVVSFGRDVISQEREHRAAR